MTDKQDPITHAARLLREAAEELRQAHTLSSDRNNWIGEPEAKAAYDEHMAAAQALEDWEAAVVAGGAQALSAAPAVAAPAAPTPEHIAAMERAWLWMDNQADQQSKGGHATFDLMMLREERDALRAAIDAAPKAAPAEVLGWIYEDELPESYPYSAMFLHSKVDTVRMFPVFGPQAASPTPPAERKAKPCADMRRLHDLLYAAQRQTTFDAAHGAITAARIELSNLMAASPTTVKQQAAPKAAPGDQRKAFESWARRQSWIKDCGKAPDGDAYGHWDTQKAWLAWAAALAAPQQEAIGLVESAVTRAGGFHVRLAPGAQMPAPGTKLYTAPQPAPAPLSDDVVKDAARWRWLSEHIGAAWNEGKFTSLVRIVSDKNRAALNASIDRLMTGDWSDAALAAQERQP